MKRMLTAAVALICMTLNVPAQQATGSIKQQGEKLAKAADADPKNWRKQFDAADFFLNLEDTTQSGKYIQRALEIAQKMEVKKDTILPKSLELLAGYYMAKGDYVQGINTYDKALGACIDEFGYENKLVPPRIANIACNKWLMYMLNMYALGDVDCIKNLREAFNLNNQLPEGQRATGLEEAETMYALAQELLLLEHQRKMKDKVWQWYNPEDGKLYTILAFNNWTLEQPEGLIAEMFSFDENKKEEMKHGLILMDEQGKVREMVHGELSWNIYWRCLNDKFSLGEKSSLRLATVTPERRQEMIEALNGRRQQIIDDFRRGVAEKKIDSPMKINPNAINFKKPGKPGTFHFSM
ncbi:MAG: hypothetical protein IK144_05000 [Bacteroidaceae bacterium]|nr:hypothetical protein [Bacteroidaceae bacterium]